MKPLFTPGKNIAIKVPAHEFEKTVAFYRDILRFDESAAAASAADSVAFRFGDKTLWVDKVSRISQAEIWLEVVTDDLAVASRYLEDQGCARRDDIEPLPEGLKAIWISSPSNIIHLVAERD